ncbi:MAG TPA: D-alanyl-D-alanine carboxypeptidase family protein [Actinomycetota bacterium]|nr:D-alanyl-D-alanine carboxypeptidase family protein [Actinomycetota bacterium]
MSLLVVTLTLVLSLSLGWFTHDLGLTSVARARAQIAADAAALAAVAEAGPYGRNLQTAVARRYASSNGAELIECVCDSGSTAVQVMVEIDGVRAQARAVMDPTLFGPLIMGSSASGMHPLLQDSVERLLVAARGRLHIVSGFRSTAEQTILWEQALARYGSAEAADDWVAPPGHSMHGRGLAVDLGGDLALAVSLVDHLDLPLYRPMAWEPWHFELIGSR